MDIANWKISQHLSHIAATDAYEAALAAVQQDIAEALIKGDSITVAGEHFSKKDVVEEMFENDALITLLATLSTEPDKTQEATREIAALYAKAATDLAFNLAPEVLEQRTIEL